MRTGDLINIFVSQIDINFRWHSYLLYRILNFELILSPLFFRESLLYQMGSFYFVKFPIT